MLVRFDPINLSKLTDVQDALVIMSVFHKFEQTPLCNVIYYQVPKSGRVGIWRGFTRNVIVGKFELHGLFRAKEIEAFF